MQFEDYKCESCEHITEYIKRDRLADFPAKIECEKCGKDALRIRGIGGVAVSEGQHGNASTAYTKSVKGYQHSTYGKNKGKRVS